jgi:arginine deiminase
VDLREHATYGGPGWAQREGTLADEIARGDIWAPYACNSEWGRLRHVVLYCPGPDIQKIASPNQALHFRPVRYRELRRQFHRIRRAYQGAGVHVHRVPASGRDMRFPNLMFQRDLFCQTSAGAVVSRMASPVRSGEEQYAARTLANLRVPIELTINGTGLLEGSDLLWVSPKVVLCGVGRRTNESGQRQVAKLLETLDVECRPAPVPKEVQHLLGCVQVVSPERALVRAEIASDNLLRELARLGLEIVSVSETDEVAERWALNFVVLEPDRVIVSDDTPVFRRFLEGLGIQIADAVPLSQYVNAAGGLACATGILARDLA